MEHKYTPILFLVLFAIFIYVFSPYEVKPESKDDVPVIKQETR